MSDKLGSVYGSYIEKIDHIGVAVKDIRIAEKQYLRLGYRRVLENEYVDMERKIQVQYLELGQMIIELVAPLPEESDSPVDGFLKSRRGYQMYHICYNVSDMDKQIAILQKNGYRLLEEPKSSPAMGGRCTAYLLHRELGLVELAELNK